ncbi:NNP family nitrate/nitrite transporter-like MFS transporter [Nitrospina gracilis]|nr:MFS transporter [Nitrospina sp. Nb-3]MCF8723708.1 NNP family nitrate/nitrite transporter-like MFS transporter [Nitrospina sp. Nb-3]
MFGFDRNQQGVLHLTWIAFFLTFLAWFNMAPFNTTLEHHAGLSADQIRILMVCNVALTIPARIVIGALVDQHGPKIVFVCLLVFSGAVSLYFAQCTRFNEFVAARLLMGVAGAGFVVGIKMIAEWFPPEKMGTAQGIYAGWGNFGAAAAAFTLPPIAAAFDPATGWRVATAFSGVLCLVWAWVYHRQAKEIPERATQFPVTLEKTIEVTSYRDLVLQVLLFLPLYGALGVFVWKLSHPSTPLLSGWEMGGLLAAVGVFCLFEIYRCLQVNLPRLKNGLHEDRHYPFQQIVVLSFVYALTFGSELAVISMFPEYLETTFALSATAAAILGSSFAFFNLVTRPSGGWLADRIGRRRVLFVLVLGCMICYWFMGEITPAWPLTAAIALCVVCSMLAQAGNGACFAMVPLIRKDLTGKMAGMAGAYGNVGAVYFLTLLSFVDASEFFRWISAYALFVLVSLMFLKSFNHLHNSFRK